MYIILLMKKWVQEDRLIQGHITHDVILITIWQRGGAK